MPDTPSQPPKTYTHQIPAAVFKEAFTTLQWSDEQTLKFNALGMERLTGAELVEKNTGIEDWVIVDTTYYTLLTEAEVMGYIQINNLPKPPHWVLVNSQLPHITITNCTWNTTDFSIVNSTTGYFDIYNSTTGYFNIDNSTTGYFNIDNSTTEYFHIENSTTGYFNIDNSTTGNFSIYYSTTGEFNINNSTTGYFSIDNSTTGYFSIRDNSTTGYFEIQNSTTGNFSMENSSSPLWEMEGIQAGFYFSKATIGQCRLNQCNIAQLTIKNECEMELYISGGSVNLINFAQLSLGKNTILSFSKTAVFACYMNEFSALGNLYFRGITVAPKPYTFIDIEVYLGTEPEEKELENHYYAKKELLTQQKEDYETELEEWQQRLAIYEPTFCMVQSSLGKTEFTECDLDNFRLVYSNAKLTEIFMSGNSLPTNIFIYKNPNEPKKAKIEDLYQKKAFYDQLKKVFENQGDTVRGTYYHAKSSGIEMNISIREGKIFEWLVYFFNLISNNHGKNWQIAFVFIVVVSHIGFYCYNAALIPPVYAFEWGNTDYLGDYAQFILPTHKIDFMTTESPPSDAVFIDVVFRIIIGYGIYQLISAFRKHGKKA